MCGICGAVWTDSRLAIERGTLREMIARLRHRGPDDEGAYTSQLLHVPPAPPQPGVALGHRRLAIIDVDTSRQPLANENGAIRVVFNGEIYNYRELRKRLEGNGHQFHTAGDTETLVHLYEDEGPDFVRHLVGMFAIAIWDAPRRRLVLARDRIGQKPLYYRHEDGRLSFASELKSLLAIPGIPREIDPAALDEYLTYQYVPHPHTIYREISKLPPAHVGVFHDGQWTVTRYWEPQWNVEAQISTADAIQQVRDRLSESVRLRLRSDVPLGAFLSGGIDSSILTAIMQQESGGRIQTFSIGFPEREYDESPFARRVAEHLGTEHHELRVEPNAAELLPKLVWHFDEPFGDSSAVPTYYLAQLTKQHVTVAISGDGGDELFCGYDRYRAIRWAELIDRLPFADKLARWSVWDRLPNSGHQKSQLRRIRRFLELLRLPAARRYAELVGIFNESRRAALFSEEFVAQLPDSDPIDFLAAAFAHCRQRDAVTAASLVDIMTYLPCDLCHKVDIATMAHGLECRQPFLDHRLVELAVSLPSQLKLRGRRGKWLLREAFGSLLPAEVFQRPKQGFGVPLDHWFRGDLRSLLHDVLLSPTALARGYFRPEAVRSLVDEHLNNQFDHSARLWALLVLEMWQREWANRAGEGVT
ncbi:MAG: asparagine synthase (glutamine-hydrolyzing) [Pirellulales bacterium]